MRQLACRTARGVCLGRARARCQTAALFFVATRWQIVAIESPPRKTTNFVLHAGRPAVCMPDGPCRLHPDCRDAGRYDVSDGGGLPIIRAPHHDRPLSVSDGLSRLRSR